MKKLVSIIIPVYNCERFIKEAIESAVEQTWPWKEIIVVDDGSNDKTLLIAKQYESANLRVVHQENGGVSRARKFGLKLAQGDYIQWLDADDILDSSKIERQLRVLEREGVDVLATGEFGSFYFRHKKAIFKKSALWQDLTPLQWFKNRFRENCWIAPGAWLMSHEICMVVGPWDEKLCLDEDGEYFCRAVSRSKNIKFVTGAKFFYRRCNNESLSMKRSDTAITSLINSMKLSFEYFRAIENSEATKNACLAFMGKRILEYYPNDRGALEKVKKLCLDIGGKLPDPDIELKLLIAKTIFGWKNALLLRDISVKLKTFLYREIDKMIYTIELRNR
jgi:glycosyltransferase involved in cell wall biosynthesis